MKKGHYIKQDADELLTGEISNEDCAVFKAYYQLKASFILDRLWS